MQQQDMRSLQGFRQVLEFLGRTELKRADVDLERHRVALSGVVDEMGALAARRAGQRGDSRALASQRQLLRRRVEWEFLSLVWLFTRQLVGAEPTLAEVVRVPSRITRLEELLAVARAVVTAMETKPAPFAEHGFGPPFVEGFKGAIAALQSAVDVGGASQTQRAGATAELRRLARRGRNLVSVLDVLLRPVLLAESGMAREWRGVRHWSRWQTREPSQGTVVGAIQPPEVGVRAA